ncbi:MAG: rhomboid family intramembrane serine protease [Spirulinaceae cyanobacterium]
MNLNQLLIWTICLSCIAFLIRAFRSNPKRNLGWVIVAGAILTITLVGWAFVPDLAGVIGGVLWGIFLLVPLIGFTKVNKLIYQQRYKQARFLAVYLRWLHPADGWFEQPELLRALSLGQRGQMEEAFAILQHHQNTRSPIGRDAAILLYWMGSRWHECLAWMRQNFSEATLCKEPGLALFYLRGLGETGDLNGLLRGIEGSERSLERSGDVLRLNLVRMYGLAFCGEVEAVEELLETNLSSYSTNIKRFWQLTAQRVAGNPVKEQLLTLQNQDNYTLKNAIAWRLSQPLVKPQQVLNQTSQQILTRLKKEIKQEARYSFTPKVKDKKAYATFGLIALNVLFFLLEIRLGGSTNTEVLSALGALEPGKVWQGEWWRLLNANFLHFGYLHLLMNMIGLYFLGPYVEMSLGISRFLLIYLTSGIGTMFCFTLIAIYFGNPAQLLVGASAAIMGLLGAVGAILLKGWRQEKARIARKRLRIFLFVVVLQVAFDAAIPEVSGLAHILGLILGFCVGSVVQIGMPLHRSHGRKL